MTSKGKNQLTEGEIKERDLKKFTNSFVTLFKSVHNITNFIVEKDENGITNSDIKAVVEALKPTIKYISSTSKVGTGSKGGKKSKAQRDPNMPKKPPSPYFLFCGKMRSVVSKRDSSLHPQQVVTELGKLWKELTEEQKNQYKIEAEKLKAEYEIKLKEYLSKSKDEKEDISDYSSSSSSSSEEDEVESEEDSSSSSDDERKDKKIISKKNAKSNNDKKRKRKLNDDNLKKIKPSDDKKKLKKPKKVLVKSDKKVKPQPKQTYPVSSSDSSSSSSSESDSD